MITSEQKILAIVAHLGYLLGGIGTLFVPLIIFFWKKDDPFVQQHAKQALVAQAILVILGLITSFLMFILVGFLLLPILAIVGIVFFVTSLIAAYKAFQGEPYEYPFIQGIVQQL